MCVIMLVTKTRPTDIMIEKAWLRNDDGGGAAWRDGKEVVWKKGIENVEEMLELAHTLPLPYVLHFRIASSGGIRRTLTHPFPVDNATNLALEGRTKDFVLFHNGDWKEWAPLAREAAIKSGIHIPRGKFSDTRAMAWLCSIYGVGFMEFLPEQKGVAFSPTECEVFTGNGWSQINDVWCSNDYFLTVRQVYGNQSNYPYGGKFCRYNTCTNENLDANHYCPLHKDGKLQPLPTPKVAPPVTIAAGTGGSQTVTPFRTPAPGTLITVAIAEEMHKQVDECHNKLLSKNKLKEIIGLWEKIEGKDVKQQLKAKAHLMKLSQKLIGNGLRH